MPHESEAFFIPILMKNEQFPKIYPFLAKLIIKHK